jgi:HD-like signal output (HDOD) protein/GGDEF domain-containing protein
VEHGNEREPIELNTRPFAALEILRMVHDDNVSAKKIGLLIEADPALSARVLRLANSPYYGVSRTISSASQAVVLLGMSTVKAIAVGAACGLLAEDVDLGPDGLWARSITTAVAASVIASEVALPSSEAFTAGLLSNVGISLLHQQDPITYKNLLRLADDEDIELEALEQTTFGSTHSDIGASALEQWRFPQTIVRAVAFHHQPTFIVADKLARVVIAANAAAALVDDNFGAESTQPFAEVLATLGIGMGQVQRILDRIVTDVDALAPVLGVDIQRSVIGLDNPDETAKQLSALRSEVSDPRELARKLATTSCLLELAKLASSGLGLANYVGQAVEVIGQFVPVRHVRLEVLVEGLPPLSAGFGAGQTIDDPAFELSQAGNKLGWLQALPAVDSFVDNDALAKIASEISFGLSAVVENERLRRAAASADAIRVAATITDPGIEQGLTRLADALACLPMVAGSRVTVRVAELGAEQKVQAGLISGESTSESVSRAEGSATVELFWPLGPPSSNDPGTIAAREVADILLNTLSHLAQARHAAVASDDDPVTGVATIARARTQLAREVDRALRLGEGIGLVVVKIDDLESSRDRIGDDGVNATARAFAERLTRSARGFDTVAYAPSDMFWVICPVMDAEDLRSFAQRILERGPIWCAAALPDDLSARISAGIAIWPSSSPTAMGLADAADSARAAATAQGNSLGFAPGIEG